MRRFFAFFTVIFILSCATPMKEKTPPPFLGTLLTSEKANDPQELELYLKSYSSGEMDLATRWWIEYRLAKLWKKENPSQSCLYYAALSNEKEFPLKELAYLRSREVCITQTNEDFERLFSLQDAQIKPWLKELDVDIAYRLAKQNERKDVQAEMAIEKSREARVPSDKLYLAQEALSIAKEYQWPDKIFNYQERVIKIAPRLKESTERKDRIFIANDFRKALQFQKAIELYRQIAGDKESTLTEKIEALRGLRQTYKLMQDKTATLKIGEEITHLLKSELKKNSKSVESQKAYLEAQLNHARALWTEDSINKAIKVLDDTIKQIKGKINLTELYWIRARMSEEAGQWQDVLLWLDKMIPELVSKSEYWEKSHWLRAWTLRRLQKFTESNVELELLLAENNTQFYNTKYRFWLAKNKMILNDNEGAKTDFTKLIQEDAMGYYGLLSYRELGTPFPPLEKKSSFLTLFSNSKTLSEADWLISLGEAKIAQKLLDSQFGSGQKNPTTTDLYSYLRAGHYSGIFNLLNVRSNEEKFALLKEEPEFFFPHPYIQEVTQAAEKSGTPAALIQAIIRQESAFNPFARSAADAFGLMQLLPTIAKRISKEQNLKYEKAEDLYQPEINIPIGAYLLANLKKKFQNQFLLVAGSYNASEGAVLGWVKTRYRGDALEFVEDVPYEETRTYMKLVLRNFIFYTRLEKPQSETPFPEWCLNGLQDFKL